MNPETNDKVNPLIGARVPLELFEKFQKEKADKFGDNASRCLIAILNDHYNPPAPSVVASPPPVPKPQAHDLSKYLCPFHQCAKTYNKDKGRLTCLQCDAVETPT